MPRIHSNRTRPCFQPRYTELVVDTIDRRQLTDIWIRIYPLKPTTESISLAVADELLSSTHGPIIFKYSA